MFEGFAHEKIDTSDATINLVRGGSGDPVLLLHGYPQSHAMYHLVSPRLAERFTVVATDLRGYGDSSKPASAPDHFSYSKRASARDQVEVMEALGFGEFAVVGHDRGARVGHRMALDHSSCVTKLALLDIIPTHAVFANVSQELATDYYHWFFLIQPPGFPETLIGRDPAYFLEQKLGSLSGGHAFAPEAMAEYIRCFSDPEMIRGTCEDYRAGASIGLEHDEVDLDRQVVCPVLLLWGAHGKVPKRFDPLAVWREKASDVRGVELDCGHYLPEELPDETADELIHFLAD